MRILHLMLSNFYIDKVAYQENMLTMQNHQDGHTIQIIASTETFIEKNKLGYTTPGRYTNEHGVKVIRLPYRKILPHFVMKKVRSYPGVYGLIEEFNPDVILHHGVPAFELLTVVEYKKHNPRIRLYLDSHSDFHNSARNWFSREVLHRRFYGPIVRKSLPYVDKILCVNLETMDFLAEMYRVPREMMEFYPLGGFILEEEERKKRADRKRAELGLDHRDILMVHSGKMQQEKWTLDLLKAFAKTENPRFRLCLVGIFNDDIRVQATAIVDKDCRIEYVGWQDVQSLVDFLCAADIYLQPKSQSATMQNALCCGCPVMLFPYSSHEPYIKGNGFYVQTPEDIIEVFRTIGEEPEMLTKMGAVSLEIAKDLLDYKKLAARLYS